MALTDPLSITIDGTAYSLARVIAVDGKSQYNSADGNTRLVVLQSNGKRRRTAIRLEKTKVAADPLTAINAYVDDAVYIMFDRPLVGFSNDEIVKQLTGLVTLASASSYALVSRALAGES